MSTPNPTHIIAEGMREVATEGQKGTPGTREDGQLWGAFPNTMTLTDLAEHVVSKLTDAGYSIVPSGDVEKLAEVRAEEARQVRWNAFCELSDLRCLDCNLRYGERKDYSCPPDYPEIGGEHSYAEDDVERLTAAAAEGEK